MENKNLELWKKVEKTDPKYTKKAKVGGMNITSIAPQYQIRNATEQFGAYGETWGFRNITLDYSMTNTPITIGVQDWNTKQVENISSILGLVGFKATFFFPKGEFEIINSIKIFTDNKHSKIDDNYAKKLETDALTKALSKLGFNADVFLGLHDDSRYVAELNAELHPITTAPVTPPPPSQPKDDVKWVTDKQFAALKELIKTDKAKAKLSFAAMSKPPYKLKGMWKAELEKLLA